MERRKRAADRKALWKAFEKAKVATGDAPAPEQTEIAIGSALRFVGKAAAPLALIPMEDMLGLAEQPNLPGTVDEHPNWRRRYGAPAPNLLETPQVRQRIEALRESRR